MISVFDQVTGQGEHFALDVGPGEVLGLNDTSCPSACPVGSVELQQSPDTSVRPHSGLQSVVLFVAGLAKLLPDIQHPVSLVASEVNR